MTEPTSTPASASKLLNPGSNPQEGAPNEGNQLSIPEEYANHPALQGITDMDGLLKKVVSQESLIGKKYIGIPDDKSSPEEVAKYREAIGVPIDFKSYNIEATPEIKQIYGNDDTKVMDEFKQLMFNAGLSQNQAQQMREGYDKILGGIIEQKRAEQAKIDADFEQLVAASFGNQKEEKLKVAQEFIQQNVSDNLKEYLPHVLQDNKSLMVIADMANNIYPNLKPEDLRNTPSGVPGGVTPESVKAKMQEIIASPAYQDKRNIGHDQAKHDLAEQAKLFEQITRR